MMKRQAFQEAVDSFRHRTPFQPFVIELEEGEPRILVVDDPKKFNCYAGAGTYLYADGRFIFVDHENVLRVVELAPVGSN
jgi:hypothetical protein